MKNATKEMILTSIFGAIILALGLIPNIGYIMILPGVAITILHVPVIIGFFVLELRNSLILGALFGLTSFFQALNQPAGSFNAAFINPLISVLPRILFALAGVYILKLFKLIIKKEFKYSKPLIYAIITLVTAIGLFFGVREIARTYVYDNYLDDVTIVTNDNTLTEEEINLKVEEITLNYANRFDKLWKTTSIVVTVVVIILAIIYAYLVFFSKFKENYYIPSVFILSTFFHSIFVLTAVTIFKPKMFLEMLGNNTTLIGGIMLIALSNGLVEAIFGALIGSPVVLAITKLKEDEEDVIID